MNLYTEGNPRNAKLACWVFSFYVGRTHEAVRRIEEAGVFECGELQASAPYAGVSISDSNASLVTKFLVTFSGRESSESIHSSS